MTTSRDHDFVTDWYLQHDGTVAELGEEPAHVEVGAALHAALKDLTVSIDDVQLPRHRIAG